MNGPPYLRECVKYCQENRQDSSLHNLLARVVEKRVNHVRADPEGSSQVLVSFSLPKLFFSGEWIAPDRIPSRATPRGTIELVVKGARPANCTLAIVLRGPDGRFSPLPFGRRLLTSLVFVVAPAGAPDPSPVVSNCLLWRNWVVLSLQRPNDVYSLSRAWKCTARLLNPFST